MDQDLYRDPDRMYRPVPTPRLLPKPRPGQGPGSGCDHLKKGQSEKTEEFRVRDLVHKWMSLENSLGPGPGQRPGLRPKPQLWTSPKLRDSEPPLNRNLWVTEETKPGPHKPVPTPRPKQRLGSEPSPEPQSLKSDVQSLFRDADFRGSEPGPEPQPDSFKSGGSIHRNIDFRLHLDSTFQRLEEDILTFVKEQLKNFKKVLASDYPECLESEEDEEQSSREAFLKITLDFLRRMKQEQLAEHLRTKTVGSQCEQRLRTHLQQRFSCVFEGITKAGKPTLLNQIYTELYITEGEPSEVNHEHEVRHIETFSRKLAAPETTITCEGIFKGRSNTEERVRTVLTKGVAGVGKTVLTQKFSLDWAEGRANQDIQLLFPFTFRELNVLRDTQLSLVGLLHHFFSKSAGLCSFEQLQVVFIFDGLDECRLPLDFTRTRVLTETTESVSVDVLLVNLIRGTLLPSARLWITTRPAAANQIPAECVSMVTEVRGFTDPQKEQYFRKRFRDEQEATAIISHIRRSRTLHIMSHIPVFCWILSTVLKHVMETGATDQLPQTLTQMYIHFLVVQAKVKGLKYDGRSETDLPWTPETRKMVESLGKLAFEQLQKGNLIFYESDLRECGLDAAAASVYSGVFTQVFREEPGLYQDKVYCFIHLSVQEFLAALHVHITFFNSGENLLIEDDAYASHDSESGLFYKVAVEKCLHFPNGHLDLFLRFLLGLSVPTNQKLLRGLMSELGNEFEANQETAKYIQKKVSEDLSTDRVLNLFHCLSELNDRTLVEQIQQNLRSGLLDQTKLSPAQWSALAFILLSSDRDLDLFDLKKYCVSETALLRLLPVVKASTRALLNGCHLSEKSCSALGSALVNSGLKDLDLSNNNLQDSGVEQLCMGLKSGTCRLEILRLTLCNLSEKSCLALGSALVQSGLKELDLSNNDLRDSGVEQLCMGLKCATCRLETLRLSGCLVTDKGCSSLAAALSSNPSHLSELDLSHNHPGSSGVKLLSALQQNRNWRLHTLRLEPQGKWWMSPGLAKYSCEVTLDPSTAHKELRLLKDNRMVQFIEEQQQYAPHPKRFDWYPQVLCSSGPGPAGSPGPGSAGPPGLGPTGLGGRSYWEVDWSGGVAVAVSYSRIRRRGDHCSCVFGWNDHSWRLWCSEGRYAVCHDSKQQVLGLAPSRSGRVGVFLDHPSGSLSFYEVLPDPTGRTDLRIHLHTFQHRFTEPLLPGFGFGLRSYGSTALICGEYHEVLW